MYSVTSVKITPVSHLCMLLFYCFLSKSVSTAQIYKQLLLKDKPKRNKQKTQIAVWQIISVTLEAISPNCICKQQCCFQAALTGIILSYRVAPRELWMGPLYTLIDVCTQKAGVSVSPPVIGSFCFLIRCLASRLRCSWTISSRTLHWIFLPKVPSFISLEVFS